MSHVPRPHRENDYQEALYNISQYIDILDFGSFSKVVDNKPIVKYPSRGKNLRSRSLSGDRADHRKPFESEEFLFLLENRSMYIEQLENENLSMKESLSVMKNKIVLLTQENSRLNDALNYIKSTARHSDDYQNDSSDGLTTEKLDTKLSVMLGPATVNDNNFESSDFIKDAEIESNEEKDFLLSMKKNFERISTMHIVKNKRLEVQLKKLELDLDFYRSRADEYKTKLDALKSRLFNKSSSLNELLIQTDESNSNSGYEQQNMMEELSRLRSHVKMSETREKDAYEQIKLSLDMAEQGQKERLNLALENEQLKEKLVEMQMRFNDYMKSVDSQIKKGKEEDTKLISKLQKDLDEALHSKKVAEKTLEKIKTKHTIVNLERFNSLPQLSTSSQFSSQNAAQWSELRTELSGMALEHQQLVQEASRLRLEISSLERDKHHEKIRLERLLADAERRMRLAENSLESSEAECVRIAEELSRAKRKLSEMEDSLIKKERVAQEDLLMSKKLWAEREENLMQIIRKYKNEDVRKDKDTESMMTKQASLIIKLRAECKSLVTSMETLHSNYEKRVQNVNIENSRLLRIVSLQKHKIKALEESAIEEGKKYQKLKKRLAKLEEASPACNSQVTELLKSEELLKKEKRLLEAEIMYLKSNQGIGVMAPLNT